MQIENMDSLVSTLTSILVECGKPFCGPVCLNIKNIFKLQSNIQKLETDLANLKLKKNDIKNEIEVAEKDGKVRTFEISSWLTEVDEVDSFVITVLAQNLNGCCLNCSLHWRLSKQVGEKLEKVEQLMSNSNPPYTVNAPVKVIEQLPGPSIKNQKTAAENLAMIMDLLKDDKIGRIGMLGMGGIGKTTLIKNLNNELESFNKELEATGTAQPFTVVIWVVVSKEYQLEKVQDQIAERLKMTKIEGESTQAKATRLFNRLQMEKRFIIILDDVWEAIDLDVIGIPRPKDRVGCKLILTTRLQDVCRDMETDVEFPVAVLNEDESWDLFCQSAGETVHADGIKLLAEAVTKECGGLPLAIITVGRAMRGKTSTDSWRRALKSLERSNAAPYIQGIERKLFLPLKLSYDSLEGKNIRPCFLYCCLYPEDFSIEINELLQCWEAEGLLDEQEEHEEAYSMGLALIENLKDSCLLESGYREGTVRLHDVVRDVAVWIASSEDEYKSLIRQRFGSTHIPGVQTWGSYKRVSFMYGKIEVLPDSVSQCSQVSSLLLQGNAQLHKIPFGFLEGFLGLRALNLSETGITSLPPVEQLRELRALFLRNCLRLRQFPPLGGLSRLQVLDLSGTCIEMSSYEAALMLKEVSFQDNLLDFYVDLKHVPNITFEDSAWLRRLRRFRISIGSSSTTEKYLNPHTERVVYLCGINSLNEALKVLWSNATALILVKSQRVIEMWTGVRDIGLASLKSITVDSCSWTVPMGTSNTQNDQVLLPSLEILSLRRITKLSSLSDLVMQLGTNIRIIEITSCHDLKQLFPFRLLHKLASLEEIYINSCHNLIEIIADCTVPRNAFPTLRIMELKELPRMSSVCQQVLPWSCLTRFEVKDCPLMKKLPFSSPSANTMPIIKGEPDWWYQLQWESEDIKSSFQQIFQPL